MELKHLVASDIKPRENPDQKTVEFLRWNRRSRVSPDGDDLLALQMLHAYGLVEEEIKSSIKEPHLSHISSEGQARDAVRQFVKNVENAEVERIFRISPLGDRFLKFMGLPKTSAEPNKQERRVSLILLPEGIDRERDLVPRRSLHNSGTAVEMLLLFSFLGHGYQRALWML